MRRPTLVRMLALGALAVLALGACDDSGSSADRSATTSTSRTRRTTTTTDPAATTTTAPTTTTTSVPATSPTTSGPPPGSIACGERGGPISDAVLQGGLAQVPVERYTLVNCRIASANQIWAAVTLVPGAGASDPTLTVALERIGAIWTVRAYGERSVACDAPAPVPEQLGLGC